MTGPVASRDSGMDGSQGIRSPGGPPRSSARHPARGFPSGPVPDGIPRGDGHCHPHNLFRAASTAFRKRSSASALSAVKFQVFPPRCFTRTAMPSASRSGSRRRSAAPTISAE